MMTLKEYAESRAVSYETVRVQTNRYTEELKGHIKTEDNRKILDDFACEFLDKHRLKRNVVVKYDNDDLKQELMQAQQDRERLKDAIILLQKELQEMTSKHAALLEDRARTETLLLLADKEHDQLEEARAETKKAHDMLSETQKELSNKNLELVEKNHELSEKTRELGEKTQELGKYRKTIFGLYKKEA